MRRTVYVMLAAGIIVAGALAGCGSNANGGGTGGARQGKDYGICPVMGGASSASYSTTYKGQTYYFCCPSCITAFNADPEKYLARIKDVAVEAFQFGYAPSEIRVKKDDIVRITLTSRDVTHGFSVAGYGIDAKVDRGTPKKVEFLAGKAGSFPVTCSVPCGSGHEEMKATLVVTP